MPPEVRATPVAVVPSRPSAQGAPFDFAQGKQGKPVQAPNQIGTGQGGRYRLEFHPYGCPSCRLRTPHAFLLLSFLVEDVEAEREVSDLVCSRCEPERFARLQQLAPHLATP